MTTETVDDSIQLSNTQAPGVHKAPQKWFTTAKVRRLANTWLHQMTKQTFSSKQDEYEFKARSFTLFICSVYPDLKVMRPQILSYLQYMNRRYLNEGPQCLSAFKAYKRVCEEMLDKGMGPMIIHKSWGRFKYKAVKPLALQFLHLKKQLGDDLERISLNAQGFNSVLRFYDVYPSSQKEMTKARDKFISNILSKEPPSIYPRDNSWQIVDDLKSMFESKWFKETPLGRAISDLQKKGLSPAIGPRLATSSGLVKYRKLGEDGRPVETGTLPSIIGAPYEIYKSHQVTMVYQGSKGCEEITVFELNKRMAEHVCALTYEQSVEPSYYEVEQGACITPGYEFTCESMRRFVCIESNHKPRIIAKGDWMSQSILQPVHDALFIIMKRLEADYAHNQSSGFMALSRLVSDPDSYVSSKDLTAATDMFPLWFQRLVMEYIFGTDFADCWANVMCRVPFQDGYYYHTGQPMGLYSSWAAFALSHHVLVHLAAWRTNDSSVRRAIKLTPTEVYGICGDDVFVRFTNLSDMYSGLMGLCGVTVNNTKSFIAEPGKLRIGEFVKRNSWRGHEISALSPNLIVNSFVDYSNAYQLLTKLKELGYPEKSLTKLIELLELGSVRGLSRKASTSRVISRMKNIPYKLYGMSLQPAELLDANLILLSLAGYIQSKIKTTRKVPDMRQSEETMSPFAKMAQVPVPGLATQRTPLVEYLSRIEESPTLLYQMSAIRQVVNNLFEDCLEYDIPLCDSDITRAIERIDKLSDLPKTPSYDKREQRVFLSDFADRMSKAKNPQQVQQRLSRFLNPIVDSRLHGKVTIKSHSCLSDCDGSYSLKASR